MNIPKNTTISEIVTNNFRSARIFEKYGLSFCGDGKKTIESACAENNIDTEKLIAELETLVIPEGTTEQFDKMEADLLAHYIMSKHHTFVYDNIPAIECHLEKAEKKHGEKYPILCTLKGVFTELKNDLFIHMAKEERLLFPYVRRMSLAYRSGEEFTSAPFGTIDNPVKVMESEHNNADNMAKEIIKLTESFTPPEDACTTIRVLYQELKEFTDDLKMHIHLENDILFPKAKALEEKLTKIYTTL